MSIIKRLFAIIALVSTCTVLNAQLYVQLNSSDYTCYGLCTGFAQPYVSGGVLPYSYLWSINGQTSSYVTGLCPGTYTVTVTDNVGTTGTDSISIYEAPQISIFVSTSNTCAGSCVGYASVAPSGGIGMPYQYVFSSGYGTQLCAGNYSVTVGDSYGCSNSQSFTISENPNPISGISLGASPEFCGNGSGSAWVDTVTGGTPGYTYHWSNGYNGQTLSNISTGTYCVTATDYNGCKITDCIAVDDSVTFNIILDSISPANCANNQLGYIGISMSGSTGPYGINWSPGGMTSEHVSNLSPGTYSVTVIDSASLCSIAETFQIVSTYNIYASVISHDANCGLNGSVIVTPYGANPPFSFLWNDPNSQTDSIADGLGGGAYTVTVTDAIGCTITAHDSISADCHYTINGNVFYDINQNCIHEAYEPGLYGVILSMNNSSYGFTDIYGNYSMNTNINPISLAIDNLNSLFYLICPSSNHVDINFTQAGDTVSNVDFAIHMDSGFDLAVYPHSSAARPGFMQQYNPIVVNLGADTTNAILYMQYDPNLQFSGCNLGGIHNAVDHSITWTFTQVAPRLFGYQNELFPSIEFIVPASMNIGDTLYTYYELQPISGDLHPQNNIVNTIQQIFGSYDPNDISVNPIGLGPNSCILPSDSVLNYHIRFQNTGTDTAFTVIVVDTLSPYVNPATFEMGSTSHPCTVSMQGDGILSFRFDQILLPDSNVSQGGSNGFITYSVHADPGLAWNTVIENRASIYFDFNAPVITNTVLNTLCEPVTVPDNGLLTVSVFPNPANSIVTFSANEEIQYVCLFDICGKKVMEKKSSGSGVLNLCLPDNLNGVYLYEIRTKDKTAFGKVVVE